MSDDGAPITPIRANDDARDAVRRQRAERLRSLAVAVTDDWLTVALPPREHLLTDIRTGYGAVDKAGTVDPSAPPHPGVVLRHGFLEPLGIKLIELAREMKVSLQTVSDIVCRRQGVSARMAWLLADALGTRPAFWMELQAAYDLAEARPGALPSAGDGSTTEKAHRLSVEQQLRVR